MYLRPWSPPSHARSAGLQCHASPPVAAPVSPGQNRYLLISYGGFLVIYIFILFISYIGKWSALFNAFHISFNAIIFTLLYNIQFLAENGHIFVGSFCPLNYCWGQCSVNLILSDFTFNLFSCFLSFHQDLIVISLRNKFNWLTTFTKWNSCFRDPGGSQ